MLKIFWVGKDNNIDWAAHGYEFCGEAGDGEQAFPLILKQKPDIVITDIQMPFMDGLSLIKLIKNEMPWTEIIILSGDEKFEYAREGIRLGVARYLVKPVSAEELWREMDSLAQQIGEKRTERELGRKYRADLEKSLLEDRKQLFRQLVTGARTAAELLQSAHELDMDLTAMWYNIVLINMIAIQHADQDSPESSTNLERIFKNLGAEFEKQLLIFDRDLGGKALLFQADSKEELRQLCKDFQNRLKELVSRYENVQFFGGIGEPVNRLGELPESFAAAGRAYAQSYLEKKSAILANKKNEEALDLDNIDLEQMNRGKMQEFLKVGSREGTIRFVEAYLHELVNGNIIKTDVMRQYIVLEAYFCVRGFLEDLQFSRNEILAPDITSDDIRSEEGIREYLVRIIEKALVLREKAASNRYRDVVDEVMRYIGENYSDEELSLNTLASHVNFSPNHLSAIFSQQTGQTFIKYLTDIRMNKAKELLRCTGKKTSVISAEVGYKDPHYFSYLFKKTQGMTPTQFRCGKNYRMDEHIK